MCGLDDEPIHESGACRSCESDPGETIYCLIQEKKRYKHDLAYLVNICGQAIKMDDAAFTRGFLKGALEHVRGVR